MSPGAGHRADGRLVAATTVELESDVSRFSTLLFAVTNLGPTSQLAVCQRKGDTLSCLPDAANMSLWPLNREMPPQISLPMQLALSVSPAGIGSAGTSSPPATKGHRRSGDGRLVTGDRPRPPAAAACS